MSAKDKLDLNQRSHGKKTASQEKAPTGCQELLPTDKGVNNETRLWCITTMPWVFMGVVHVLYDAMNTVVGVGAKYEVAWGIGFFFPLQRSDAEENKLSLCWGSTHLSVHWRAVEGEREAQSVFMSKHLCNEGVLWIYQKKKKSWQFKGPLSTYIKV